LGPFKALGAFPSLYQMENECHQAGDKSDKQQQGVALNKYRADKRFSFRPKCAAHLMPDFIGSESDKRTDGFASRDNVPDSGGWILLISGLSRLELQ
jgi:hypothetical protein